MAATQQVESISPPVKEKVERTYKKFDDTVQVHTDPSGTQYVFPIDILLDETAFDEMVQEVVRAITGEEHTEET